MDTEEFIDGQRAGELGEVLIRQVAPFLKSTPPPLSPILSLGVVSPGSHSLPPVSFRCNNVLYIRGAEEGEGKGN